MPAVVMLGAPLVLALVVAQPILIAPAALPGPPIDSERLAADVRHLSTAFGARDLSDPAGLDAAAAWIAAELGQASTDVSSQYYTVADPLGAQHRVRNVLARFAPTARPAGASPSPATPAAPSADAVVPLVVVGAHYDAYGGLPGADDNASGVAGLLALARVLPGTALALPVELVAYTLEEPPHFRSERMGSFQHAAALARAGQRVRAMLALEMLGCFDDRPGSQAFPLPLLAPLYPDSGSFIALIGQLGDGGLTRRAKRAFLAGSGLDVRSMNGPAAIPGVDFSDHASYWRHDLPALMVTDTAFYRNRRYHTADDTWDTLDYRRMAQVVQGVHAIVRDLAGQR